MRLEHLTFAVAKRIEHEMFHKEKREELKRILAPTPGQSVLVTAHAQKQAQELTAAFAYQLAESVIETMQEIYERSCYH